MSNLEEYILTPFGEGLVSEKDGDVVVVFRGPYGREALEWALNEKAELGQRRTKSGPKPRHRMLTLIHSDRW